MVVSAAQASMTKPMTELYESTDGNLSTSICGWAMGLVCAEAWCFGSMRHEQVMSLC